MENMGAKNIAGSIVPPANLSTCTAVCNFPSVHVRPHRTNSRNTMLKAIFGLFPVIIPALIPSPGAQAQRPFALRLTANSNGGIILIGNSTITCDSARFNGGTGLNAQRRKLIAYEARK
jgi:hypothetical protein